MLKKTFQVFTFISLFFVYTLLSSENIEFAPLNPEFQKNFQSETQSIIGDVPLSLPGALYAESPASFDLRSYNKVSPIKNQGSAGSCWAFATYSSLESYLSGTGNWDFSENHMKNILSSSCAEGFDRAASDGGNHFMSTAYLVRWSGPVPELEDPYNPGSTSSPENLQPVKHVQEVIFIPDRKHSTDNNGIKQAIMKYGAIYTTMYYNNAYLAKGKNYYYNGHNFSNHAVSIVGWIDSYSRTNFYGSAAGIPPGDGAFIVKNSWGTLWGESGYFYISYYDTNIGNNCAVFNNAEPTSNYNQIYQYDPLGWVTSAGFGNDTAHFANIFSALQSGVIQAVGFYTPVLNSQYEIKIYKNCSEQSPVSGLLATTKSGNVSDPGYHTIKLFTDVPVSKNEKFSAVVRLKTPGCNYPIPMEVPISGYSSKATAVPGQSFVSKDGVEWTDITSSRPGSNVCIKVYGTALELDIVSPDGGEQWEQESTKMILWKYTGNIKGNVKLELLRNGQLNYIIASGIPVGVSGNGSYNWKIPASIQASDNYKIRITSIANPVISDTSSSTFSIINGMIKVENPVNGTIFSKGTRQLIQWKSYGKTGGYVKIELLKAEKSLGFIASAVPSKTNSTNSYVWIIPSNIQPGDDYSIKVISTAYPSVYGTGEKFSIAGPSVKLRTPAGNETCYVSTVQTISWLCSENKPKTFKIEYLRGNTSASIAQLYSSTGSGSYNWFIPSNLPASDDYRIKISAMNDPFLTDTSEPFTISKGSITVVSPLQGDVWRQGETRNIVWRFEGNPGSTVRIELLRGTDYAGFIGTKSIGYGKTGTFIWKIPSNISPGSDYKIRIITNPDISSTSGCFSVISGNTTNRFNIKDQHNEIQEYDY